MNNCTTCQPEKTKNECEKYTDKQLVRGTIRNETDDSIELFTDVAGFNKEDIEISVVDNLLSIACTKKKEEKADRKLIYCEFQEKDLHKEFALSDKIDTDNISAQINNGVLKLTLKKAVKAQPKKITIN